MFRALLPDEAPEVTYEPATDFTSTMVEFQARILKNLNSAGVVSPKYGDSNLFLTKIEPRTTTKPKPLIFHQSSLREKTKIPVKITLDTLNPSKYTRH